MTLPAPRATELRQRFDALPRDTPPGIREDVLRALVDAEDVERERTIMKVQRGISTGK